MGKNGKTGRRHSSQEKAAAVWMVGTLRAELGTERGTAQRVALQLGYGVESVWSWVRQADIDDRLIGGVTSDDSGEIRRLEQENRELKRANEILKRAASFFGAEPGRQHKMESSLLTRTKTASLKGASLVSSPSAGCCRWRQARFMLQETVPSQREH